MLKPFKLITTAIILASNSPLSFAASPWLPAPESGNASMTYIYTTADEFFKGKIKKSLPHSHELEQHSGLFNFEYGYTDQLAVDMSLGYSRTEFVVDPKLSPKASNDGLVDPTIGLRYKVWDELEDGGLTLTLRTGIIIGGGYKTGALNSIGDDAFGLEFSTIGGKIWENGLGFSTELGYRYREDDVPDEFFANISAFYSLSPLLNIPLSISFNYQVVEALSGIDIGSPGFSPARFTETEEDFHIASGGLTYSFEQNISATVSYGATVFSGRNTSDSQVVNFGLSYGF